MQNPVHPFHITYLVIFSSYVACHVHNTYMLQLGRGPLKPCRSIITRPRQGEKVGRAQEVIQSKAKIHHSLRQQEHIRTCKWVFLDLENQPEPRHNDRHCAVDMNENDAPHLQGGYRSARNMSHSLTNGWRHLSSFNSCSDTENAPDCCPPAKKDLDLSCASPKCASDIKQSRTTYSWTRFMSPKFLLSCCVSCSLLTTHMVQSCHVCQAELLVLHAAKYNSKSRRPCDNMW